MKAAADRLWKLDTMGPVALAISEMSPAKQTIYLASPQQLNDMVAAMRRSRSCPGWQPSRLDLESWAQECLKQGAAAVSEWHVPPNEVDSLSVTHLPYAARPSD
jgi:hypothetical protein